MNDRERLIILPTMIAFGVWLFLTFAASGEPPRQAADSLVDSLRVAASLKQELNRGGFDAPPELPEIISKINLDWEEQFFISGEVLAMLNWKEQEAVRERLPQIDPSKYIYSGFLGSGDRQLAIINGLDYLRGDMIDGLLVDLITAQAVHLRHDDGSAIIPLEEE